MLPLSDRRFAAVRDDALSAIDVMTVEQLHDEYRLRRIAHDDRIDECTDTDDTPGTESGEKRPPIFTLVRFVHRGNRHRVDGVALAQE